MSDSRGAARSWRVPFPTPLGFPAWISEGDGIPCEPALPWHCCQYSVAWLSASCGKQPIERYAHQHGVRQPAEVTEVVVIKVANNANLNPSRNIPGRRFIISSCSENDPCDVPVTSDRSGVTDRRGRTEILRNNSPPRIAGVTDAHGTTSTKRHS